MMIQIAQNVQVSYDRYGTRTFVWTANQSGPHADFLEPVNRVKSNVARDEGFVEVVNALQITIHVATKLL